MTERLQRRPVNAERTRTIHMPRPDAAAWAALWGRRPVPRTLLPGDDKTERRMVLLQWLIMPLVLTGCVLPPPRLHEPPTHALIAAAIMALHPMLYVLLGHVQPPRGTWKASWHDALLTAADVTVATLVFYATAARPGYAQVLLYCAVALAATRYTLQQAFGITSLVALLLVFGALLPLHVAPPTLASEIIALYALTYLIGLLSQAEKAVSLAAIENARLAQTVLQRNRELGALNRLARALNAETNPTTIVQLGLDGVVEALDLGTARAYLREEGELRLAAQVGAERAEHDAAEEQRRRAAGHAVALGRTVTTGWSPQPGGAEHLSTGPPSISIPLVLHGHLGAVVQVDLSHRKPAVTDAMLETLEVFCSELAVALENAMLRREAHRTAILQEKNRIAQELHDTVLQMLFGVGLRLQWSLEQLPAGSALREPLEEARHLSARAGGELRGAIFTLCSDIAEIGLVPAVERLVQEQAARAGWSANVVASGAVPELPALVQNAAHRVVREALMNAYKHARATEVVVSLRFTPATLTVVVQDNGVGIPAEALAGFRQMPDHFGLRSVAEQVESLGGELAVYNNDEQGAAMKAVIPLAMSASEPA
jgi:signal transduction histidine kinase